ncbi:phosphotransferase [Streptomyces sp. NBC_01775]|uniref:phosphotransferase n=1 Tax=Streptomyces sp. NBC_01775 TaxID=2975939 RepID=UPI002DDA5E60|nr:phosphotransferase [Streptomyces sp. NBC_01775]WSB74995.1 phosphotransferase [Streptomyces sp. NBC_01775]
MSNAPQRHTEPVDVHVILRREGTVGPEVLLSRRAGTVYASGLWHLPSGHLDGPHEDVVEALVREAREETGVVIDPVDVRTAATVHHRSPGGDARLGLFFEVRRWQRSPHIREPQVCDAMGFYRLDELPAPMVAYCRAGLDAYRSGGRLAVHFQEPGDSIACNPAQDRLRLIPATGEPPEGNRPKTAVREFAERAVGPVATWTDTSWSRETSQVWRASGRAGGTWYVKVHAGDRFHGREVTAYRTWIPHLGAAVPRLVAADAQLRAIVVTAVPGRPLHGAVHPPEEQQRLFRRIGALASAIHRSASSHPAAADHGPNLGKVDRHLRGARPHLGPGDEEFIRTLIQRAQDLPGLEQVITHGDFQLRNLLRAEDGSVTVIDFERSEPAPAVRDLVRLSDAWAGRPDLFDAFLTGYGRKLTPLEERRLVTDSALDSLSGMRFGTAHGDPELVERGRRTLTHLRAEHRL